VSTIEGCQGIGRRIALRLLRDAELVVDAAPKLSEAGRRRQHQGLLLTAQ
jgi:hypothetical protein